MPGFVIIYADCLRVAKTLIYDLEEGIDPFQQSEEED